MAVNAEFFTERQSTSSQKRGPESGSSLIPGREDRKSGSNLLVYTVTCTWKIGPEVWVQPSGVHYCISRREDWKSGSSPLVYTVTYTWKRRPEVWVQTCVVYTTYDLCVPGREDRKSGSSPLVYTVTYTWKRGPEFCFQPSGVHCDLYLEEGTRSLFPALWCTLRPIPGREDRKSGSSTFATWTAADSDRTRSNLKIKT